MAKFFEALDDKLIAFIEAQPMFFIASASARAASTCRPRVSTRSACSAPTSCAYLDITGSGNETAAHAQAGGRATIMFCSFTRNPLVLRLYGRTRVGAPGSALWRELRGAFRRPARRAADRRHSTSNPARPPAASACP